MVKRPATPTIMIGPRLVNGLMNQGPPLITLIVSIANEPRTNRCEGRVEARGVITLSEDALRPKGNAGDFISWFALPTAVTLRDSLAGSPYRRSQRELATQFNLCG